MTNTPVTCFYVHSNRCHEVRLTKSWNLDGETSTLHKVEKLNSDYRGPKYIFSDDENLCYNREVAASLAKLLFKPYTVDALIYHYWDTKITEYRITKVDSVAGMFYEYLCTNTETQESVRLRSHIDEIFDSRAKADRHIKKLRIVYDELGSGEEELEEHSVDLKAHGDTVFDVKLGHIRRGHIVDRHMWYNNKGCLYICQESEFPENVYSIHSDSKHIAFTKQAILEKLDVYTRHKCFPRVFNVDDMMYVTSPGHPNHEHVETYRVTVATCPGHSFAYGAVRVGGDPEFAIFYDNDHDIFHTHEAAMHSLYKAEMQASIPEPKTPGGDGDDLECREDMPPLCRSPSSPGMSPGSWRGNSPEPLVLPPPASPSAPLRSMAPSPTPPSPLKALLPAPTPAAAAPAEAAPTLKRKRARRERKALLEYTETLGSPPKSRRASVKPKRLVYGALCACCKAELHQSGDE